jgi:hypothetical protein
VIFFVFAMAFLFSCTPGIEFFEYSYQVHEQEGRYNVFTLGTPKKIGAWKTTPDIYICKRTPITTQRIDKAMNYWKKLGYKFGTIHKDVDCIVEDTNYGIKISLPDNTLSDDNLALTRTARITETQEIIASHILIHAFAITKERVLEHEIGHALGWQHYSQKYHMMHPNWHYGGHGSKGLKAGQH